MTSRTTIPGGIMPRLSDTHRLFLERTVDRNRGIFGGFKMEDEPDADKDKGGDADKDKGGKTDPPIPETMSKADAQALIEQRLGEQKRKHERELEQAREDAGKSDTQRIEAERDRANEAKTAAVQKAAPKVAQALAQVAAIALGGRPDRAAAIVRQADLDGVAKFEGDEWSVDETKINDALTKVLGDYPEWKADASDADKDKDKGGDQGKGKGHSASGGDLGGGGGGGEVTLEKFRNMSMKARIELKASDPEQYRKLSDAEIDTPVASR